MAVHRRKTFLIDDCSYDIMGREGDPCIYCGQEASGHDHVPPLAYVFKLDEESKNHLNLRKYPACQECNVILGDILLKDIRSRRAYVHEKLRSKYASCLRMPAWDEEELQELGRCLQDDIRSKSSFATHLRKRLAYYR
jgi:hypothetical protein